MTKAAQVHEGAIIVICAAEPRSRALYQPHVYGLMSYSGNLADKSTCASVLLATARLSRIQRIVFS